MRNAGFALLLSALLAAGCGKSGTDSKSPGQQPGPGPGAQKEGGDGAASRIDFVGTKPNGKHVGGFKSFTVNVGPTPIKDDLSDSKISVDIDTDSLWSDNPKLTGHLKSPDFFEVQKYPKATFVSTKIEADKSGDATHKITGDLTLHGTKKQITIPAKVAMTADQLQIDSEFTINRHDYGISYGKGKVDDTVTIKAAVRVPRK